MIKSVSNTQALTRGVPLSSCAPALRDSFASFQRCRFRPRVLVDVAEVDPRTTILGAKSTLPIYIAPAAHARLGHELGEVSFYCIELEASNSSYAPAQPHSGRFQDRYSSRD